MTTSQTPLVDILRLHAEDLYSDYGHNKSARLLSQAADEIERLRSNALALEEEKNDYMDGVGDVLGQDHDGETLWAAAQRVMSECDRLRAELAELRRFRKAIMDYDSNLYDALADSDAASQGRGGVMDRFDPCGTDECKKRCDSYGVACDDIMADEIDRLRAELAESKKEIALLKTPNIVWDFDDPENSAVDSVADAVYQHIDWWGDINVGDVMTFLTARKLSNVTIRITSVNDDGEVTFEAIDAAMAGGE